MNRIIEEAFNQGNLAVMDELLSTDHYTHNAFDKVPIGLQGLKWLMTVLRTAFPDLHCTLEDEIQEGNQFAAHFSINGTHKGSYLGNPPTGKLVVVQGIIFARIKNRQIVEDWTLIDQLGILQQLGLVPPLSAGF